MTRLQAQIGLLNPEPQTSRFLKADVVMRNGLVILSDLSLRIFVHYKEIVLVEVRA